MNTENLLGMKKGPLRNDKNAAHHMCRIFILEQRRNPINNPIKHSCDGTVENDRTCYGEYLRANAEDKALCCCQYMTQ